MHGRSGIGSRMRLPTNPITLDDVDREHGATSFSLAFADAIERVYRRESALEQRRPLVINSLIGCALFDSFIIADYFITGRYFIWWFIGRFCVVTPIFLATNYIILRSTHYNQILICLNMLVMAATAAVLLTVSEGSYRSYYFFGIILIMICSYVIGRPRIPYAITTVLLQCVCYQATLALSDIVPADSVMISTFFSVSGVVVTIMAAYAIERIDRRAFLLGLRVRLLNRELEAMAMTDPLTGLGNRRSLDEATSAFWRASSCEMRLASLILVDVDHFKPFNDNYGHSAGDACLATIAERIRGTLRDAEDRAVRFGGEEMVVFLPDTGFTQARAVAEAIRSAIHAAAIPHPVLCEGAVVTASFGVATAPTTACTPAELIARADTALYAAKHNGRNQVWPPIGRCASGSPRDEGSPDLPVLAEAG